MLTTLFLLLGLVFVLGGLGGGDWAGPEIMGVVLLLLAAFGIRAMATSVLIATPAETGLLVELDAPLIARLDRDPVFRRRRGPAAAADGQR